MEHQYQQLFVYFFQSQCVTRPNDFKPTSQVMIVGSGQSLIENLLWFLGLFHYLPTGVHDTKGLADFVNQLSKCDKVM